MSKISTQRFQEAGLSACKDLQNALQRKSKSKLWDKVAARLLAGTNSTLIRTAFEKGKFYYSKKLPDDRTSAVYLKLIIEVFGAKEAEKRELSTPDGKPLAFTMDLTGKATDG